MKLSIINTTVLCCAALSFGAPFMNTADVDDFTERSREIDELNAREWYALEARTGPFFQAPHHFKLQAHTFINEMKKGAKIHLAAAPGSSSKTVGKDSTFHLDRQVPTNSAGEHKVAVQLGKVRKHDPTTVGQVFIHGGRQPSDRQVANALKHSVTTGRETHINHPNSKKSRNIAANHAAHENKAARVAAHHRSGMRNAKLGNFKKGRK